MTIFHHHNIINVLISHFLIMTLLVHLHQLQTNTQNTSHPHTVSFGGFWETPNFPLLGAPQNEETKGILDTYFLSRIVLFTCGY